LLAFAAEAGAFAALGGQYRQQRNAAYLNHALATGRYPQLADLLAPASPAQVSPSDPAAESADRYRDILAHPERPAGGGVSRSGMASSPARSVSPFTRSLGFCRAVDAALTEPETGPAEAGG
jgi:hypothetical protein